MNDRPDRRYLKRSLGFSAGLHLLVLPAIVALFWYSAWGNDARLGAAYAKRESMAVSYLRIVHRGPAAPAKLARPRVVVAAPAPPARLAAIRTPHRVRDVAPARAVAERAGVHPTIAARPPAQLRRDVALVADAPARAQPSAPAEVAAAPASPTPPPTPLPSVSPSPLTVAEDKSARGMDVPPGAWGQSFAHPIVADDAALDDLRARFPEAWHASVEIAEDGHPTRVTIPSDLPEDVRAELERRLMELRYVPAECNGLRCAGTLLI